MPSNDVNDREQKGLLTQESGGKKITFIGRVVKDKDPNSRLIDVYVQDLLPFYSGKLEPKEKSYTVPSSGTAKARNYYKNVEWEGEPNRRFPPDVKKGEQVNVTIFVDQDKAFWSSMGRDDNLRRSEKIEITAANTGQEPDELSRKNTHGILIDTQEGNELTLHTSKGNKNRDDQKHDFAYTIKLNAKEGKIQIADDNQNVMCIESGMSRLYMKNKEGATIEINKKRITIMAPEDILIKAGKSFLVDSPLNYQRTSMGPAGIAVWEYAEMVMKGLTCIIEAPCIGLKGAVEASNIVAGPVYATSFSGADLPDFMSVTSAITHPGRNIITPKSNRRYVRDVLNRSISHFASNTSVQTAHMATISAGGVSITIPDIPPMGILEPSFNTLGKVTVGGCSSENVFEGYGTYKAPSANLKTGIGVRANNVPNLGGGALNNRHCTAWEQMLPCIQGICRELGVISGAIEPEHSYTPNVSDILQNAQDSLMPWNRGK